jgi:hypothetical protein
VPPLLSGESICELTGSAARALRRGGRVLLRAREGLWRRQQKPAPHRRYRLVRMIGRSRLTGLSYGFMPHKSQRISFVVISASFPYAEALVERQIRQLVPGLPLRPALLAERQLRHLGLRE